MNTGDEATFDERDLRRAFGVFATGVTIVTTVNGRGQVHGFTANSFTSVSIDPPLLLVSIARSSYGAPIFTSTDGFAVNILTEKQRELSNRFATSGIDKFADTRWRGEATGSPIFERVAAWFDCSTCQRIEAGDHVLLIGKVLRYGHSAESPLGFCRGAYVTYGLTPQMLQLVSSTGELRVGALIESQGRILLQHEPEAGEFRIPLAERVGDADDESSLIGMLAQHGIVIDLPFLYSAYHVSNTRYVYYRGELESQAEVEDTERLRFVDIEAIPWSSIRDYAVRRLLKRYCSERDIGNHSVYIGGRDVGDVYPGPIQLPK